MCTEFGLTLSIPNAMLLVTERETVVSHINSVDEFQYLGSRIAASGRMDGDLEMRIEQASRALGALCKEVFKDKNLTFYTKGMIYNVCILCPTVALNAGSPSGNILKSCTPSTTGALGPPNASLTGRSGLKTFPW